MALFSPQHSSPSSPKLARINGPQMNRRFYITLGLVVLNGFMSLVAYGFARLGWDEPFPFFHWKLYSQPLGAKEGYKGWRIYYRPTPRDSLQRMPVQPIPGFSETAFVYTLYNWVERYKQAPEAARPALKALAQHAKPGMAEYRIVEEQFQPLELYRAPYSYDTCTVVAF
jgi:hypothetical protein